MVSQEAHAVFKPKTLRLPFSPSSGKSRDHPTITGCSKFTCFCIYCSDHFGAHLRQSQRDTEDERDPTSTTVAFQSLLFLLGLCLVPSPNPLGSLCPCLTVSNEFPLRLKVIQSLPGQQSPSRLGPTSASIFHSQPHMGPLGVRGTCWPQGLCTHCFHCWDAPPIIPSFPLHQSQR